MHVKKNRRMAKYGGSSEIRPGLQNKPSISNTMLGLSSQSVTSIQQDSLNRTETTGIIEERPQSLEEIVNKAIQPIHEILSAIEDKLNMLVEKLLCIKHETLKWNNKLILLVLCFYDV